MQTGIYQRISMLIDAVARVASCGFHAMSGHRSTLSRAG
jgi:hypothetical protein